MMAYALGLPDALRRRGLTVEVVPGWETRSAGSFNPRGAVCHWTAGPRGTKTRSSLNICTHGRASLPGPLCNVYLDRRGIAVVVAAGRANHAGAGGWRGLVGNSAVFGTEAEAAGPDDWTPEQRWAYPRINAAYCDLGDFGADMICGHSEWATPKGRKVDINGYPMGAMRAQVAAILSREDDDMPTVEEIWSYPINGVQARDRLQGIDTMVQGLTRDLVPAIVGAVLDAPIDRADQGRGPTTLRAVTAWSDAHVDALASGIAAAVTAAQTGSPGGPVDVAAVQRAVQDAVNTISVKITAA